MPPEGEGEVHARRCASRVAPHQRRRRAPARPAGPDPSPNAERGPRSGDAFLRGARLPATVQLARDSPGLRAGGGVMAPRPRSITAGEDHLLTAAQVAKMLGVARRTVYEWCWERRLATHRIGRHLRIRASDV